MTGTTDVRPELRQTYAEAVPALSVPHRADDAPDPRLVVLNDQLARELGFDPAWLRTPEGVALLVGRVDADGEPLSPDSPAPAQPFTTAQAYAGHQFGQANPLLGDGRAVLLGDVIDARGRRRDIHLKGTGRTPFARGGDGRAPLGPMLREHLIGEALHALGIPTTRALAVTATGLSAFRRGPAPEPCAVLARTAASHLRVGTFQAAAWHHGRDVLRALCDHAIAHHHPDAAEAPSPALALLRGVVHAQARLVAQWMLVGFVHGVMNTDNMTISGESIDFGPCAFVDAFSHRAVFSSIDAQGRYAYGNQPGIALWNLSRLAEALLPLIDEDLAGPDGDADAAVGAATTVLEEFEGTYLTAWSHGMAAKLGIAVDAGAGIDAATGAAGDSVGTTASVADDPAARLATVRALGEDLLDLLERHGMDFTGFFRALTDGDARTLFPVGSVREEFDAWSRRREALLDPDPTHPARAGMATANPVYIPRNHHLDRALRAAELGDLGPYERLLAAVTRPFERRAGLEDLEGPGEGADGGFVTYCGT
ncbi:protein adenylyltransferase SelO [Brachybacterium huguangmaarense]